MYNVSSFLKADEKYEKSTPVQEEMAKKLISLLLAHYDFKNFENVFEFGCGSGRLFNLAKEKLVAKSFLASDINDFGSHFKEDEFFLHDMNWPNPFYKCFDLVLSNACFQWLDPDTGFENIASFLYPKGVMAITTFGERNLWQMRELSGLGLEYLSNDHLLQKLSKNYELVSFKSEEKELVFNTPLELLKHLRDSGVNSLKPGFYLGKQALKEIETKYKNTLTYTPLYIIAFKKP